MTFEELIQQIQTKPEADVCVDSRKIKNGDVFVALRGSQVDGHRFIDQAVAQGARYIVCEDSTPTCSDLLMETATQSMDVIPVPNSAIAAATLAQARYDNPAGKLINLAVTGTNGKTTVAHLVRACLENTGRPSGLVGTISYEIGQEVQEAPLTTPDALTLARLQADMVKAGCTHMITEASSHALAQERLAGIVFKAAAFTNLTGDHLDYHKTEADYLAAKARLFENLPNHAWAVLNAESKHAWRISDHTPAHVVWYGIDAPADIQARIETISSNGSIYTLHHAGQSQRVESSLPGRHNISNHLAAAGLCLAAGLSLESIVTGLRHTKCVPGRLEPVPWVGRFSVFIDYAHTDDALKNVLSTLSPLCKGKLILVFGCGGDRDPSKRPRMAQVAAQFADKIIVTSDNPRTEKPQQIIDDILTGFSQPAPPHVSVEPDRQRAIERAIQVAEPTDIVLIAGKGHETYQLIGDQRLDFSDRDVALACLKSRGGHDPTNR